MNTIESKQNTRVQGLRFLKKMKLLKSLFLTFCALVSADDISGTVIGIDLGTTYS